MATAKRSSEKPSRPRQASGRARPDLVIARRELFWNNVIREMLAALSAMRLTRDSALYDPDQEKEILQTFDGRLAIITTQGARIPIAEVHPVFACSVNTSAEQRELSEEVQCTVFQIRTPGGEVYTLPVHEIRAFHALTPELLARIEEQAKRQESSASEDSQSRGPFGFAAFTSLARNGGAFGASPGVPGALPGSPLDVPDDNDDDDAA